MKNECVCGLDAEYGGLGEEYQWRTTECYWCEFILFQEINTVLCLAS